MTAHVGNGSWPTSLPAHAGTCSVAPFRPHFWHRAERRGMSLEVPNPHRIMNGASAIVRCACIGRGSPTTTARRAEAHRKSADSVALASRNFGAIRASATAARDSGETHR
jgi:hypothetical protein